MYIVLIQIYILHSQENVGFGVSSENYYKNSRKRMLSEVIKYYAKRRESILGNTNGCRKIE